ncbi:hypothetical protein [Micropruina sp.]|uniref:hypothetical protein n=1 Tax=Micropruina sp. TaxID=2737536 RepID=UPI002636147C|nr:hypothetical protein [Micropruina sp.]
MRFSKIAAVFGPAIRRGSSALLAFPVSGVVAPSYSAAQVAAEAFLDHPASK